MLLRCVATLGLAGLLSVGCSIATPSNNRRTDIAGTIPLLGSQYTEFSNKNNGEVQVTVSTLVPTPSASLGMAIGQVQNGTCLQITGYIRPLVANRTQEFGYLNKGNFCLLLFDTGIMTVDTAFTGQISHP